ncbi:MULTISPECIES: MFS transporter [Rhizobium]|uniref:MFS family permease n=1 Tax=Rhizobium tropici TaxID=398 RepID=A0A6P1C399_RHITR|nr:MULTISPECIES: MFS transporter [Rhizobium]AGB74525.1 major facilitator superfamily (MFS) transporter [Rhizobium tropici CIAT 899]MBB4242738.1 MFS family permease [Rhizobium tropici]MBB5594357.1 MFS family permease [Rhizobium tropici]MBB6493063.1 MFS family permease [Rhizobium tropici]NEV10722.1 MFS transporter [Rhizobium tropici]
MIDEKQLISKITWRIMPFLGILYLIAYIDRQNVSYAKLQMVGDLGMSEYAYGLGASLFFIGYFIFEVPSNLLLDRFGASRWFARILISWGAVTVALAYTQNATMFYILRFLLGACEAGFFPGVLYLLTLWYPSAYRGRMVGLFMIFSAFANAIGAPLGGVLLDLNGLYGIAGWQWVFLVTGVPAILAGFITLFYLPDLPSKAPFLDDTEKKWLRDRLAVENSGMEQNAADGFKALINPRVLLMALCYIGFPLAAYGLSYWLPTIVKNFGVSNTTNGFLNIIPWLLVAVVLYAVPAAADKAESKTPYIVIPALIGAASLVLSAVIPDHTLQFVFLSIAAAGIFAGQPVFWSLPSRFLQGAGAAAGLAAINSVGNLGGFIAQNVVPWIKDSTGSTIAPMFFLAACLLAAALLVLVVGRMVPRTPRPEDFGNSGAARVK